MPPPPGGGEPRPRGSDRRHIGRLEPGAPVIARPAVEPPRRREWVDPVAHVADVDAVMPRVLEHVAIDVSHLLRHRDDRDVIAIVEHAAVSLELAIEAARDAHAPPLHPAREPRVIRRLADQVDVVRLDRELADPEAGLVAAPDERALQDLHELEVPQPW